jgi:hypothetical protein
MGGVRNFAERSMRLKTNEPPLELSFVLIRSVDGTAIPQSGKSVVVNAGQL